MNKDKKIKKSLKSNYRFIKYIWPVGRLFIKGKLQKRCTKCTLNERYVKIQDGLCEICREEAKGERKASLSQPSKASPRGYEKEFEAFIHSYEGKGSGNYDALVFFSGGKDSIYILHQLKMDYPKLRVLALTLDNGFRSPFGKENAEIVCKALGVDHIEIRPFEIFRKLYRYGFMNFSDHGYFATDILEGELFQDIGRNLAYKTGIPLMLLGYTKEQMEVIPEKFDPYGIYQFDGFYNQQGQKFKREEYLGKKLTDIFSQDEMKYWWDGSNLGEEQCPIMVYPFAAWEYDKAKVEEYVAGLGLIQCVDPSLTNDLYCLLGIIIDYKKWGYCTFEPEWAKYVRDGRANRIWNRNMWELIEYGSIHNQSIFKNGEDIKQVLERLQMTWEDINGIL